MNRSFFAGAQPVLVRLASPCAALILSAVWITALAGFFKKQLSNGNVPVISWSAVLCLLGAQVVLTSAILIVVLVVYFTVRRASATYNADFSRWTALFLGLLASVPFYLLGHALASGDWVSAQWWAPLLAPFLAAIGAIGFSLGTCLVLRFFDSPRQGLMRYRVIPLTLGGLSAAAVAADIAIFPGLYSEFHTMLYLLASLFALVFFLQILSLVRGSRALIALRIATVPAAVLLFIAGFSFFTMNSSTRSELLLHSQMGSFALRYFGLTSKTDALHEALKRLPSRGDPVPLPRGLLRVETDWNLIFVVVDALRADALPPSRMKGQSHARPEDTPFLNSWIKDTFRFSTVYAPGNMTEKTVPSIFRSIQSFEIRSDIGVPIADYMRSLRRTPVAVVNRFFKSSRNRGLDKAVAHFIDFKTYSHSAQQQQVGEMVKTVEKVKSKPFFAWFHFYCLHDPGFAGTEMLSGKKIGYRKVYRTALKWLDSEIRRLFAALEKTGVMHKTIVVLTADHGEGLYTRDTRTHGTYLFDEEVRVPLYIKIPGKTGGKIDKTVGTIDLLPTIGDLSGAPAVALHRGKSLVPLMVDPARVWLETYYMENKKGDIVGVVRNRDKLMYHIDQGVFVRFDLVTDPKEKTNLFDIKNDLDQDLLAELAQARPSLFKDELHQDATRDLYIQRLKEVDVDKPGPSLNFLLQLAPFLGDAASAVAEIRRISNQSSDKAVRRATRDTLKRLTH
jgi:glucan phosphoethanolaminetransferase (alkaline phosphatase superfamily)